MGNNGRIGVLERRGGVLYSSIGVSEERGTVGVLYSRIGVWRKVNPDVCTCVVCSSRNCSHNQGEQASDDHVCHNCVTAPKPLTTTTSWKITTKTHFPTE